jgi:hypothetical protein
MRDTKGATLASNPVAPCTAVVVMCPPKPLFDAHASRALEGYRQGPPRLEARVAIEGCQRERRTRSSSSRIRQMAPTVIALSATLNDGKYEAW